MRKSLVQRSFRWAFAALCLGSLTSTASAGSFTRQCAARDMQVLMVIEERESASAISAQKSTEAVLEMMEARMICFEGRVLDALAIYDSIVQNVMPNPVLSGRGQ